MTRKNYEALAVALADSAETCVNDSERFGVRIVACRIAQACKADNARFNVERFLTAAGVK